MVKTRGQILMNSMSYLYCGIIMGIGYEFTNDSISHNIVDGEILRESNYKYWKSILSWKSN